MTFKPTVRLPLGGHKAVYRFVEAYQTAEAPFKAPLTEDYLTAVGLLCSSAGSEFWPSKHARSYVAPKARPLLLATLLTSPPDSLLAQLNRDGVGEAAYLAAARYAPVAKGDWILRRNMMSLAKHLAGGAGHLDQAMEYFYLFMTEYNLNPNKMADLLLIETGIPSGYQGPWRQRLESLADKIRQQR